MTVIVDVHLTSHELQAALRRDVRKGLLRKPKELPPKHFYDERGSQLFEQVTALPAYYATRCERAILAEHADEVAKVTRADTVVALGPRTSDRTRLLLTALRSAGTLRRFVPFDVDETTLRAAAESIAAEYAGMDVHAVAGDVEEHLELLPRGGTRLVTFLGGSIGNLRVGERATLLDDLRAGMGGQDALLLGTDLVKDPARLVAAYDDAAGITAEFNRNALHVLNRELRAGIDVASFEHVARWDADEQWMEMWLRSTIAQRWDIPMIDLSVAFAAGEEMRTEISATFTRAQVTAELGAAGLTVTDWWTDPDGDFALSLSRP